MKAIIAPCHAYGDDVDTDRIIAGKYTKTLNPADLAARVLEDLDPDFRRRMQAGDILVGGENFGCGSSREQAPLALQAAGVSAVVAASFARIFYRNAINTGLPVFAVGPHRIRNGSRLHICPERGEVRIPEGGITLSCRPLPPVMAAILTAGGLVPYMKQHGRYPAGENPQ